jgi:hypothetical protein
VPTDNAASERREPHDLVDDADDTKALEHAPHGSDVTEGHVLGAVRLTGPGLTEPLGDLLGRAQILLGDDARFAVHPSRLGQVVVDLALLLLSDDRCHI